MPSFPRWFIVGPLAALMLAGSFAWAKPAHGSTAETSSRAADRREKGDEKGAERLVRTRSSRHIQVLARDLRLDERAASRLQHIAESYFEATGRRLVVTGGTRTVARQAQLMFEKLSHGDDVVGLYEHKQAATELRAVFRDGKAQGLSRGRLLRALRDKIDEQIAAGVYVSRHLKAGAADVRSRGLTEAQEKALRAAVKEEPGVALIDERQSAEPHLHLSL